MSTLTTPGDEPVISSPTMVHRISPWPLLEAYKHFQVLHSTLQSANPFSYDLSACIDVTSLPKPHAEQTDNWVRGESVYRYLRDNGMLVSCFGIGDWEALVQLGKPALLDLLKGLKSIYFWRSAARSRNGTALWVPVMRLGRTNTLGNIWWHSLNKVVSLPKVSARLKFTDAQLSLS